MKTIHDCKNLKMLEPYCGKMVHCLQLRPGSAPYIVSVIIKPYEEQDMFETRRVLVKYAEGTKSALGYSFYTDADALYLSLEDAISEHLRYQKIYESFKRTPYLSFKMINEHFNDFMYIQDLIYKLLSGFENFNGIDFCDVHAGGIQVRIHHKKIKGYTYGQQQTILYDFSNKTEIPWQVAKEFVKKDNEKDIKATQDFIKDGETYGWD